MAKRRVAAVVVAGILAATALGSVASASAKLPPPGTAAQVAKLVAASHLINVLPKALLGKVASAGNDNPGTIYPLTKSECTTLTQCIFGDTKAAKTIVLMGDSHAQMWIPAINRMGTAKKLKIVLLFLPVCPVASLNVWITVFDTSYAQCTIDRNAWIAALNKSHPMAILLTERTYGIYSAASDGHATFTDAQWKAGLETTITDLQPSKAKIAVLGDIVTFNSPVPSCLAANVTSVQKCSVPNPNPARPNHASAEKAAAKAEKVLFVDPTKWACTKICSPVIGPYIAYYDQYHFSVTYDGYLSGVLTTALKSVL